MVDLSPLGPIQIYSIDPSPQSLLRPIDRDLLRRRAHFEKRIGSCCHRSPPVSRPLLVGGLVLSVVCQSSWIFLVGNVMRYNMHDFTCGSDANRV